MGAEILRKAASLMRERAQAAPGDHERRVWTADSRSTANVFDPYRPDANLVYLRGTAIARTTRPETAEHIASWHPAVALAVADWLDTAGADLWAHGPLHCAGGCMECDDDLWAPHVRLAVAVARAYLGEDTP